MPYGLIKFLPDEAKLRCYGCHSVRKGYPDGLNYKVWEYQIISVYHLTDLVYLTLRCRKCKSKKTANYDRIKLLELLQDGMRFIMDKKDKRYKVLNRIDMEEIKQMEEMTKAVVEQAQTPEQQVDSYLKIFSNLYPNLVPTTKPYLIAMIEEYIKDNRSPYMIMMAVKASALGEEVINRLMSKGSDLDRIKELITVTLTEADRGGIIDDSKIAEAIVTRLSQESVFKTGVLTKLEQDTAKLMDKVCQNLIAISGMTHASKKVVTIDKSKILENASVINNVIAGVLMKNVNSGIISQEIADNLHNEINTSLKATVDNQ